MKNIFSRGAGALESLLCGLGLLIALLLSLVVLLLLLLLLLLLFGERFTTDTCAGSKPRTIEVDVPERCLYESRLSWSSSYSSSSSSVSDGKSDDSSSSSSS